MRGTVKKRAAADPGHAGGQIGSEIYAWNVRFDSRLILFYFLNYFIFRAIKGTGCQCIVGIRGT